MKESLIGRTKKRVKESVRLRTKRLTNEAESIYLDIYSEGKRTYEFLKMYLYPEVDDRIKEQNRLTLVAAEAIKAQRVIDLNNAKAGIKTIRKIEPKKLADWLNDYRDIKRAEGKTDLMRLDSVIKIISNYEKRKHFTLEKIDRLWIKGYIDWLSFSYRKRNGNLLDKGTVYFYVAQLSTILNVAVINDYLHQNPFNFLKPSEKIKRKVSDREFLTLEELKRMAQTDCSNEIVKRAYLFSCYCGLRVSDIRVLKWENIIANGDLYLLSIEMKKTKKPIYIPLTQKAMAILPTKKYEGPVFRDMPTLPTINRTLKAWGKLAGLNKNVTFHTARHTFGTLMITAGVDLYTTSKLMGHTDVRTTQIYAKIVDRKKIEAVSMLDTLLK